MILMLSQVLATLNKARGSETGVIPICPFPPIPQWGEKRTAQMVVIIGTKEGSPGRIRKVSQKRDADMGVCVPRQGTCRWREHLCGWRLCGGVGGWGEAEAHRPPGGF